MLAMIDALHFDDVHVDIQKDTASVSIKNIDRQVDSLNNKLMTSCKCQSGMMETAAVSDSTILY